MRWSDDEDRVVATIPGYLYDTIRGVAYPGVVEIWSQDFAYKTVRSRFYGPKGNSFLVREEEGEFYRGVFWLRERNDNLAKSLVKRYLEDKIDDLREQYTYLMDQADIIKAKLDKAYNKLGENVEFEFRALEEECNDPSHI